MRNLLSLAPFAVWITTSGCTASNRPLPGIHQSAQVVSTREAATLPFSCAGTLLKLTQKHYENLDMAVTPYLCATGSGMVSHAVDAQGQEWSWDDLRLADHAAFRSKYGPRQR